MAVTILKCYRVTLQDGECIDLYSERDLTNLDSTLRYAVSIERVNKAGLGCSGVGTFDGHPVVNLERVTSKCDLAETERRLLAHKQARKLLDSHLKMG